MKQEIKTKNSGEKKHEKITIRLLETPDNDPQDHLLGRLDKNSIGKEFKDAIAGKFPKQDKAPTIHGLIETIHIAFAQEKELTLRPDDLQLAIVQQVAKHVASNPEKYRVKLGIKHDGKDKIVVEHDGLILGEEVSKATKKWATVFPVFQKEINKRMIETPVLKAIQTEFSTTDPKDQLIRQICLMDVVQCYFDFVVRTKCGIPAIHLLGTRQDWTNLRDSLDAYEKDLDMEWYTAPLKHILQHFINAYSGKVNEKFWESIYKFQSRSGSGSANGWALAFVPTEGAKSYTNSSDWKEHQYVHSVSKPSLYGSGLASVPFIWDYIGTKYPMTFVAGFSSPDFNSKTINLECSTLWAVVPKKE